MSTQNPIEKITEEWFVQNHVPEPEKAAEEWRQWLSIRRKRTEKAKWKKILELATGLTSGSLSHYLSGRRERLGKDRLELLDQLSSKLGFEPPKAIVLPPKHRRGGKHLVILTELDALPSPSYHLGIFHAITKEAEHGFTVSIQGMSRSNPRDSIKNMVEFLRPDGVVFLRITPDEASLETLKRASVPVVLVHADRYAYDAPPVLTNIVPIQRSMVQLLRDWAKRIPTLPPFQTAGDEGHGGQIVIVTMEPDAQPRNYPKLDIPFQNIRAERIHLIRQALADHAVIVHSVENFGFQHAATILETHPDAVAFVCLSDQIAVGIKHLLIAKGEPWQGRIIGFDNSELAVQERITSFAQSLESIGKITIKKFRDFYAEGEKTGQFPPFSETFTYISLVNQDDCIEYP